MIYNLPSPVARLYQCLSAPRLVTGDASGDGSLYSGGCSIDLDPVGSVVGRSGVSDYRRCVSDTLTVPPRGGMTKESFLFPGAGAGSWS